MGDGMSWWEKWKRLGQYLTINERNKIFLRKNLIEGRKIADSKLKTKKLLVEAGLGVPKLMAKFRSEKSLEKFGWEKLVGNFVVKPISGYGGEGIIVVRKRLEKEDGWWRMEGTKILRSELVEHCREILAGKYSLHGMPDGVLIEERIKIHPKFLSLTKSGTPDVRVIVYNRVPVMAMLRIPTEKSRGKANLQQGAIGLGVDMATGITTFGVSGKKELVTRIDDRKQKKKIKVNGIRIPMWREILELAVKCQENIPSLGFVGVDIVLDKERGPMVLELNARPGLSIQICNRAGMKARINKVEDVEVKNTDHAIMLSKYLFGEGFFVKVEAKEKSNVVEPLEMIKIKTGKGKKMMREIRAKVDTGAYRSSIDKGLAEELGLLRPEKILYFRHYRSSLGKNKDRPVVGLTFWLKGKRVVTAVNVADRNKLRTKFLLGRKDLGGFLVSAKK